MARITRNERQAVANAMDRMARRIWPVGRLPTKAFLDLYFSPEQLELMDTVLGFTDYKPSGLTPLIKVETSVPDETLIRPFLGGSDFVMVLGVRNKYRGLPPMKWRVRPDADPASVYEFDRCVREITLAGRVKALWQELKEFYISEAGTHEEMRYLFPGTIRILSEARLPDLAAKLETVKRRPSISLDKYTADMFRYMNQWYATQMLLGTFEGTNEPNSFIVDEETTTLYLAADIKEVGGRYKLVS